MEIRQLKIFMTVCDEMSFTKAAKKLSYAQSTISDNIQVLEKSIGYGFGISFLPLTTVQKEINEESLFLVKQDKRFFHEVKILVHKDKHISKGLNNLIENTIKTYKKTNGQRLIFES